MSDRGASVMVTAKEVAERDGLSPQAVTKQVRKLAGQGMPVERDGRGRIARFSLAWYDDAREQTGDSIKSNKSGQTTVIARKIHWMRRGGRKPG